MKRIVLMCLSLAAAGVMAVPAQADFMAEYSGNSLVWTQPDGVSAHVSVAVYDNTSGTPFNLGDYSTSGNVEWSNAIGGPQDFLAGNYIYFYQVVNSDDFGLPHEISALELKLGSTSQVISAGYLENTSFQDDTGVLSNSNPGLGDDAEPTDGFVDYNGSIDFVNDSGVEDPSGITHPAVGESIRFRFGEINDTYLSTVVFFISNVPPKFAPTMVYNGGDDSTGISVTATPVPAGLALLLTGLPGLGMVMLRRKKVAAE